MLSISVSLLIFNFVELQLDMYTIITTLGTINLRAGTKQGYGGTVLAIVENLYNINIASQQSICSRMEFQI